VLCPSTDKSCRKGGGIRFGKEGGGQEGTGRNAKCTHGSRRAGRTVHHGEVLGVVSLLGDTTSDRERVGPVIGTNGKWGAHDIKFRLEPT